MSDSTKTHRIDMVATAACLGALGCWSIGPIFIKSLTAYADSWTQNMLRYAVACLFWLPYLIHMMAKGEFAQRTWRRAILPSIANITMQSLWAAGFYYLGAAFLTLLSKTSIFWVAGFSLLFFPSERPLVRSYRFWLGFALALVGLFGVLFFKEGFTVAGAQIGIVIALVTAFMWAVYTISVKIALRDIDSRSAFSVISIYTAIGLSVCGFLFGDPGQALKLTPWAWGMVIVSAITAIALGHVLFYAAIKRIGATIPMLVILTQPFAVFSLSRIIFHERLSGVQLLFGMLLLVGAALSIWAQQHLPALSSRERVADARSR